MASCLLDETDELVARLGFYLQLMFSAPPSQRAHSLDHAPIASRVKIVATLNADPAVRNQFLSDIDGHVLVLEYTAHCTQPAIAFSCRHQQQVLTETARDGFDVDTCELLTQRKKDPTPGRAAAVGAFMVIDSVFGSDARKPCATAISTTRLTREYDERATTTRRKRCWDCFFGCDSFAHALATTTERERDGSAESPTCRKRMVASMSRALQYHIVISEKRDCAIQTKTSKYEYFVFQANHTVPSFLAYTVRPLPHTTMLTLAHDIQDNRTGRMQNVR